MFLDVLRQFLFMFLTFFSLILSIFGFRLIFVRWKFFIGSDLFVATAACAAADHHLLAGTICCCAATAGHAAAGRHLGAISSAIFWNFSNFLPVKPRREFSRYVFFPVVYSRPYQLYKLILNFIVNKFWGTKWWSVSLGFCFSLSYCFCFVFAL